MTVLPNYSQAIVSPRKIEDDVLNFAHRQEKSKATSFGKFGYSRSNNRELIKALK